MPAQAGGDPRLGVRVHRRGRLDQHQDLGVDRERARQDQALALAAGEGAAALGDRGVETLGKGFEDVVGRGGVERLADPPGACLLYTSPSPRDS